MCCRHINGGHLSVITEGTPNYPRTDMQAFTVKVHGVHGVHGVQSVFGFPDTRA